MDLAPEAAAKALVYASLLLAIGASATRWLLVPRLDLPEGDARRFDASLARLCAAAAAGLLFGHLIRAIAHTASAFGWRDAFTWDQFSVIALESRWGNGWRVQVSAATFLLAAAFLVRLNRTIGWTLLSIGAVLCAVSMPLIGHATSNPLGLVLHSAHILGAGLWLGTLTCILLLRRHGTRPLLRYFAPLAFAGAGLAVLPGAIAAVQYVGSVSQLWASAYGRTLLLKLACVLGVVICAYRNWRRWSASAAPADSGRRVEATEAFLALLIVLITSVLTELAHP